MKEVNTKAGSHVVGGSHSLKRYLAGEINSQEYVEGVQAEAKIIAANEIVRSKERTELYGRREALCRRLIKFGRSLVQKTRAGNT